MDVWAEIIGILMLIFFSWQDIRSRELSLWGLVVFLGVSVIFAGVRNGWILRSWCRDLIPGSFLLLAAGCSREQVGYGDGFLILLLGLGLGGGEAVTLLFVALLLVILWGGIRILKKRNGWKSEFPFVPFLLMADGVRVFAEYILSV